MTKGKGKRTKKEKLFKVLIQVETSPHVDEFWWMVPGETKEDASETARKGFSGIRRKARVLEVRNWDA